MPVQKNSLYSQAISFTFDDAVNVIPDMIQHSGLPTISSQNSK